MSENNKSLTVVLVAMAAVVFFTLYGVYQSIRLGNELQAHSRCAALGHRMIEQDGHSHCVESPDHQ